MNATPDQLWSANIMTYGDNESKITQLILQTTNKFVSHLRGYKVQWEFMYNFQYI
jgi:hypothetical protein